MKDNRSSPEANGPDASDRGERSWFGFKMLALGVAAFAAPALGVTLFASLVAPNPAPASSATSTEMPSIGKWELVRSNDAMTDESFVLVGLVAEGQSWSDPRSVKFAMRCDKRGAPIMITWNRYVAGEKTGEYLIKSVTVRTGDNQPVEETWTVNPDGTSTMRPGPNHDFVMAMRTTDRLVVRIEPYQSNPLTVTFDTRGMTEALKQARPECEWYLRDVMREEIAAEKAARGEAPAKAVRSWHTPK